MGLASPGGLQGRNSFPRNSHCQPPMDVHLPDPGLSPPGFVPGSRSLIRPRISPNHTGRGPWRWQAALILRSRPSHLTFCIKTQAAQAGADLRFPFRLIQSSPLSRDRGRAIIGDIGLSLPPLSAPPASTTTGGQGGRCTRSSARRHFLWWNQLDLGTFSWSSTSFSPVSYRPPREVQPSISRHQPHPFRFSPCSHSRARSMSPFPTKDSSPQGVPYRPAHGRARSVCLPVDRTHSLRQALNEKGGHPSSSSSRDASHTHPLAGPGCPIAAVRAARSPITTEKSWFRENCMPSGPNMRQLCRLLP